MFHVLYVCFFSIKHELDFAKIWKHLIMCQRKDFVVRNIPPSLLHSLLS